MKRTAAILLTAVLMTCTLLFARDDKFPPPRKKTLGTNEVAEMGYSHKVGRLWTMVTNYAKFGDESYTDPNFEWPGGSGNIYGWRTSIWVGAVVNGAGTVSAGDDFQYRPLDSIHVTKRAQGGLSAEDTYTRYTDNNPLNPGVTHTNIGLEITERTYAWDQSYNGDFIICDYWIKNVGADNNKDGIPEVKRTLTDVYVAWRMDCDVSGFNGTSTDTKLWDQDDLTGYDHQNKLCYLFDGDNKTVPGDDTGNPDPVTGLLRSPGYIGIRLLSADTTHFHGRDSSKGHWTMFAPTSRYNEPLAPDAEYLYIARTDSFAADPVARDYRIVSSVGPYTIPADDSIHMVIAWVIGTGKAGIVKNSQVAQNFFDGAYSKAPAAPIEPQFTLQSTTVGGASAISILWKKNSESSLDPLTGLADFDGYALYRSTASDAGGTPIWDTIAVYPKSINPATDGAWIGRPFLKSWPPPKTLVNGDSVYTFTDPGRPPGMIYTYAVTAFDKWDSSLGISRLENTIGRGKASTQVYMANSGPAPDASKVRVVPNPFIGSSRLSNPNPIDTNPWVNRLRFINLPVGATVSIFTLAGDLVKTLHNGDVVYVNRDATVTGDFTGVAEWDLITRNNQEAVTGLYVYVVDSPSGKSTGKFVIMR